MIVITKTKEVEVLFPWGVAIETAREVKTLITSACHMVLLAGSLRRRAPMVHDIDMVIQPKVDTLTVPDLFGGVADVHYIPTILHQALAGIVAFGSDARIIRFAHNGIPVELYIAEPDGSNLDALLQMRTGPAEHNRNLAARAQSMGLSYRAGYGIYRGDVRVDDGTEEGIYKALGLGWLRPEARR